MHLACCPSQPNMDYSDHRAWSCRSHILQRLHYNVVSFLIAQWVLKVINSTVAWMFTSSCRYCKSEYHSYWMRYHLWSLWSEKWLGCLTTSWSYVYVAGSGLWKVRCFPWVLCCTLNPTIGQWAQIQTFYSNMSYTAIPSLQEHLCLKDSLVCSILLFPLFCECSRWINLY